MCFERARESSLMLSASIVTDMSTCQCRLVPSLHTGWYVYLVLKLQNLITLLSLSFSTTILIFSPDSLIVKLHVDKSPWSLRLRSVLVWKTCFFFAHLNKDSASVALIEVQFIIPSDLGVILGKTRRASCLCLKHWTLCSLRMKYESQIPPRLTVVY